MRIKFENVGYVGFAKIYWTTNTDDGDLAYMSANFSFLGELWLSVNKAASWLVTPGELFVWKARLLETPIELDLEE